jgi:hypothetical protein
MGLSLTDAAWGIHRVVNEKVIYHERAQVHFAWNPTAKEYSNKLLFMIYDDVLARYAVGPKPLDLSS